MTSDRVLSSPAPASLSAQFGPITVHYDQRVLRPRAWTLAQSTWAAEIAEQRRGAGRMLELCAGAGHIGLAAAILADCDLVQVEVDPVAAQFAVGNAEAAGWADRVDIRVAPLREALCEDERFPLVLADPPYLPSSAVVQWPEDPVLAIDGGEDGLNVVRSCLEIAARHLEPDGCLLLQVAGPPQADEVAQVLAASPVWPLRAGELRTTDPSRAVLRVDRS